MPGEKTCPFSEASNQERLAAARKMAEEVIRDVNDAIAERNARVLKERAQTQGAKYKV